MPDPESASGRIEQLRAGGAALSDEDLLDAYSVTDRTAPWLRANFVSSLDGAATLAGLSAGLSGPADHRVFDLLRRLCDVVIVGAGTVRAEGYGPMRVDDAGADWRRAHGLGRHPRFAIVSARLDLDPASTVFTEAPARPLVITTERADPDRKDALRAVAEVLECGEITVDPRRMRAALADLGLSQQHSEGGPHLLGSFVASDALDELCLTISPLLVAGTAARISAGAAPELPQEFSLAHVFSAGGFLLARYVRSTEAGSVQAASEWASRMV